MKNIIIFVVVPIIALVAIAWFLSSESRDSNVISAYGIHWHPTLEIYKGGEQIQIDHNVGLTGAHGEIHTHEDLPIIHLEFGRKVTKEDIKLKKFFEAWEKDISEFGTLISMTVNGVEAGELGEYEMQDKDRIVLRYE